MQSSAYKILNVLGEKISSKVDGLKKVYVEFPRLEEEFDYPSISLITSSVNIAHCIPQTISQRDVEDDPNLVDYEVLTGDLKASIQLDLWTDYKRQRDVLTDKILSVFYGPDTAHGIVLDVDADQAEFIVTDWKYPDAQFAEGGFAYPSTSAEWRSIFSIECSLPQTVYRRGTKIRDIELKPELNAA